MEISPSIYEHAAKIIDETPWRTSRDAELMYKAHAEAYKIYWHAPIMPGIDIYNLEPEAYGAVLEEPSYCSIPAIRHHPISDIGDILQLRPLDAKKDGRIPMQIEVGRRLCQTFPEAIVRVPISGPFSIASNLMGFDRLMLAVADAPDKVAAALLHLVEGQISFARGVNEAGVDITFFESAACPPMLSPQQFRTLELPALKKLLGGMKEIVGHPIPCVIGGHTAPIVEAMLETGTNYLICPFETTQEVFLKKVENRLDVQIRINADLRIVAAGTREQIRIEADRVTALCRKRPNSCPGTGALPYETVPENVLYMMEYVRSQV